MHAHLTEALAHVVNAAEELFAADSRIQSVGVGQRYGELVYLADRNTHAHHLLHAFAGPLPARLYGLPVCLRDSSDTAYPLDRPGPLHIGRQLMGAQEVHLEQGRVRPLACGLEIQNIDADLRNGIARHGGGYVGTLGCLVHQADGRPALLSNNHVLADEGLGHLGGDRIQQGASRRYQGERHVAHLSGFAPLLPSPWGQPRSRPVHYNRVDAAVATLLPQVPWQAGFARPGRPWLSSVGQAQLGDRVFKVGRTTGLTWGTVERLGAITRFEYACGMCWFTNSSPWRLIQAAPSALPPRAIQVPCWCVKTAPCWAWCLPAVPRAPMPVTSSMCCRLWIARWRGCLDATLDAGVDRICGRLAEPLGSPVRGQTEIASAAACTGEVRRAVRGHSLL